MIPGVVKAYEGLMTGAPGRAEMQKSRHFCRCRPVQAKINGRQRAWSKGKHGISQVSGQSDDSLTSLNWRESVSRRQRKHWKALLLSSVYKNRDRIIRNVESEDSD